MKITFLVVLVIAFTFLLFKSQHRMIFYPRSYGPLDSVEKQVQELSFQSSAGQQTAFYYPATGEAAAKPARVWVIFGGNASLALDWLSFIKHFPDKQTGFLLIDYPGYGKCQGKATPATILENSEKAFSALQQHLKESPSALAARTSLLGHSLGAAAALEFAQQHAFSKIILISPFTSLKDMGAVVVGRLLAQTLIYSYDNRARLAELAKRSPPPRVYLFHGVNDAVIPVRMGRELGSLQPGFVTFEEIERAGHNDILSLIEPQIYSAMLAD